MAEYENELTTEIMLEVSRRGSRLWRNNSGVAFHKDGSAVAYGVASPGGSDMIGFTQVEVTPDMVGMKIAVFTAVEAKSPGKKPSKYQDAFLKMVHAKGGIAVWGSKAQPIIGYLTNWMPSE